MVYMGSCCVYVYRYPLAVHSWTDGHVPILCALSRANFLIIWLLIFILLYCNACVYLYSIPICIINPRSSGVIVRK